MSPADKDRLIKELRLSEAKFRKLVENISVGIIVLDGNWVITYINPIAEDMLNKLGDDLVGKNIWQEFPETVNNRFYHAYHEAMLSQKPVHVEDYSNVAHKWLNTSIYPSDSGLSVYFHDVTEQRIAQLRANKSEASFRLFLDRITDGFIALDKNFRYLYVNKKIGALTHLDPDSLIGRNVWKVFPDAVGSATYHAFLKAMNEQVVVNNVDYYPPLDLWQENHIYPSPEGLSIFVEDITEKMKLQNQLNEQSKKQQLEIIQTSLHAQERERTYIGQELHDNVNQIVVATKLMLAMIRDDPAKLSPLISQCILNLENVINENRKIAHNLVTPDVIENSLLDQLSYLAQTMLDANGIQTAIVHTDFNEDLLSEEIKLAIYRIMQEQCTNIVKHAKAGSATIQLATSSNDFIMVISDDGKGMESKKKREGIGLKNIEGRLKVFDGEANVETLPDQGFSLMISIPLQQTQKT